MILLATSGCRLVAHKRVPPSWDAGPAFTVGDPSDAGNVRTLVVEIAPDGSLRMDGAVVYDLEEITRRAAEAQAMSNVDAHIHAAPSVPYARVVEVMDALKKAGVSRLGVGGEPGAP